MSLVAPDAGISGDARARLERFAGLLLEINQQLNLTGARHADQLWRAHIADSLALLPLIREAHHLLDLGSGGGLPGLVLACVRPELRVTLLDARRKKVGALSRMIRQLDLPNAMAHWGRAEEVAKDGAFRGGFDVVTARAVAALPRLIEWSAPFVCPGGACWFFKTAAAMEVEGGPARAAAERTGLRELPRREYRLESDVVARLLVGYRKEGSRR